MVGDKAILRSEIEENVKMWLANGQKFEGDPYCVVGEELAVQQLFLHQAMLDSVEVNDSYVMQSVDMKIEEYIQGIGSREKMEEYFRKSSTEIREEMMIGVRNQMIIQQMQSKLTENIHPTPAEVPVIHKGKYRHFKFI